MPDRTMRGIFPILAMPCDAEGRIDVEDLQRETDWLIECGVHGVGIAIASEIYKLTDDERDLALTTVVEQAAGRVPVVMNTGAQGTDLAARLSKRAEELGADALMIRPPTFMPVPADEIVEYFRRIAGAVSIPIFQQDQATAPVPPALAVRIAGEHENLCYVKVESPPTAPRIAEAAALRGDSGLILFGGASGTFLFEEVRRGAVGSMPGSAIPDVFVSVWDRWHGGDQVGAEAEFNRYAALIRTLKQPQGLDNWLYKEVLVRRGVIKAAHARRPAVRPGPAQIRELEEILGELGVA